MICITELIVLGRNIILNTSSVGTIKSIHLVQSWVELHFISQDRSIRGKRIEWSKIINARWIWIDHVRVIGWLILLELLLIKMHVITRHGLMLQIVLHLISYLILIMHLLSKWQLHIQTAILEDCSSICPTNNDILLDTLISVIKLIFTIDQSLEPYHWIILLVLTIPILLSIVVLWILLAIVVIFNMSPVINLDEFVFSGLLLFLFKHVVFLTLIQLLLLPLLILVLFVMPLFSVAFNFLIIIEFIALSTIWMLDFNK